MQERSACKWLAFKRIYEANHGRRKVIMSRNAVKHRALFSYETLSVRFMTILLRPVNSSVDKTFPVDTLKINVLHSNQGPHNFRFVCMYIQTFQYEDNIFSRFSFPSKVIAFKVGWYRDEGTYFWRYLVLFYCTFIPSTSIVKGLYALLSPFNFHFMQSLRVGSWHACF